MIRASMVALAAAVVPLAGCSSLDEGTVTAKTHTPAVVVVTLMPVGTSGVLVPFDDYIPECWEIDLRDGDQTGSQCVTAGQWSGLKVGDQFREGQQ